MTRLNLSVVVVLAAALLCLHPAAAASKRKKSTKDWSKVDVHAMDKVSQPEHRGMP
jgi:hypothetical protein